ncbi:DNA polymerase clamp loader subunit [Aeromonas phage Riv-10]|uniref:Sliding-clamp-loader small subunit n=3 Tax=Biquartavirus 44RR2 TaxID=115987 RepID=Q6U9R4_9CAUD|nr:clamp loader of DNA polymerase [Aeromonas phage 44RR2.8t]AAQ63955.1 gp62 clamp loader subunit [Aeromonas phage 44RR2.8t]AAQ81357.1 DNA polymerase accessory protein [Aeromonas phage 44RR2.8t]APU00511.1 DNA polymerase clamp loader subunit [Aeromonas phage 44RR2.8t.2]APU02093.1 DNA polymerase clamp loader subunit [Aeromonas phage Riv-10]
MNNLNFLLGDDEEQLNEHEIAWMSKDWDAVAKLADQFKENAENTAFAFMDDITYNKPERNVANTEYPAWFINNALSMHAETLYPAYVMNLLSGLDGQAQYNYLKASIRKGKVYGKWPKLESSAEENLYVAMVKTANNVDETTACMYIKIMTKRGTMESFLSSYKFLVTPAFVKKVTKTAKEQNQLLKLAKKF